MGRLEQLLLGLTLLLTMVVKLDGVPKNSNRPIGAYCENDASTECEIPLVCRDFECKCVSKKCGCDLLKIWQNGKCRNRADTKCKLPDDPKDDNCVKGAKCVRHDSIGNCECTGSVIVRDGLCNSVSSLRPLNCIGLGIGVFLFRLSSGN